jgi:hypothetical protein
MIMDPLEQALCSKCGKPAAGTHLTSIHHGIKESRFLCQSCLPSAGPPGLQDFLAKLQNSVCRFCGAKGMTTDPIHGMLFGTEEMRFLCFSCSSEYLPLLSERIGAIDDGSEESRDADPMIRFRETADNIDAHMKKWVIQRDN